MKPKTLTHLSWWFTAIVLITVAGLAEYVFAHVLVLVLAAVAAAGGAYALGRHHGRAGARKAAGRRLEDAQRAGQVAELEQLAARSLGEIVSSYRVIARRHGAGPR